MAQGNDDDRGIGTEIAKTVGIGALKAAIAHSWKQTCNNALDPHNSKGLYQATEADVLREVTAVQNQLVDLSTQIGALSNTVQVGFDGSIISKAKSLTSRLKTREVLLSGRMKQIAAEQDDDKCVELIKSLAKEKQSLLEAMTTDMGELYDLIVEADAANGRNLVNVYDQMMALSYNWGAQTYNNRQSFRDNLASTWASALYDIRLLYGVSDPEGNEEYLNQLEAVEECREGPRRRRLRAHDRLLRPGG